MLMVVLLASIWCASLPSASITHTRWPPSPSGDERLGAVWREGRLVHIGNSTLEREPRRGRLLCQRGRWRDRWRWRTPRANRRARWRRRRDRPSPPGPIGAPLGHHGLRPVGVQDHQAHRVLHPIEDTARPSRSHCSIRSRVPSLDHPSGIAAARSRPARGRRCRSGRGRPRSRHSRPPSPCGTRRAGARQRADRRVRDPQRIPRLLRSEPEHLGRTSTALARRERGEDVADDLAIVGIELVGRPARTVRRTASMARR